MTASLPRPAETGGAAAYAAEKSRGVIGVAAAVGVLFCDQVDSTRLLTSLGDEAAEELRRDLFAVLRRAVTLSRGEIVKGTGDGLMVVFPGDAADAVSCAVLMQRGVARLAAREASAELALRVGISFGDAIFDGGDWFGAAVNLAARLCAAAESGGIVASEPLVALAGAGLVWDEARLLELKGFPEPMAARRLVWERPSVGSTFALPPELNAEGSGRLVGRDRDSRALRSAWEKAKSGERVIRLVNGEAGVGVTRLLTELADDAAETGTVLFGECGAETPALAQMVRWWAGSRTSAQLADDARDVSDVLAGWVPLVGLRLGSRGVASPSVAARLRACEILLGRLASERPLLLVFDDVHLADADEIELISGFALSALPGRCLISIGYRTSDGAPEGRMKALIDKLAGAVGVETIRVEPLGVADVEDWTSEALPASDIDTGREIAALIAAETSGFPAAIVGVIDALSAGGLIRRPGGLGVPDVAAAIAMACPYKGLIAYESDDRARFFGREALVDELVSQVDSSRFVAVVGPSGSGKSSVVRAGLLPRLREGTARGAWDTITLSPGARPLDALVAAITKRRGLTEPTMASVTKPGWLAETLTPTPESGARATAIFIDQFEECFTLCNDPDERARFFDVVTDAVTVEGPVAVVIALRGDYYGHLAEHPGLAHAAETNTVLVGPMREEELRAAITGPAAAAGLSVESGLCDVVLGDVAGRPGALPLLSHALLETWRRRRGHTMALDAYREVGGVNAAIARTADRVFEHLDANQQATARRLCLRLTAVGETSEDSRRRVSRSELSALDAGALDSVISVFAQARLITTDENSIEFAHEALLREWPRLRAWLDDDREELRVVSRLQSAVAEWQRGGRSDGDLYRGLRLDAAAQLDSQHLSGTEQEFLAASIEHRNAEHAKERRAHRRLQRLVVSLAAVVAVALLAAAFAVRQSNQANHQATRADARGLAAEAIALASTKVDTALLLAAEGYRRDASIDTEGGLLAALNGARYLTGYHRTLPLDVDDMALSPDGNVLVALTYGGELRKYDAHTWASIGAPLAKGVEVPYGVSVSPDGKYVAFGAAEGVRVFELDSGAVVGKPFGPANGNFGSFSSDGSMIVTTSQDEPLARLFDVRTGEQVAAVTVDGRFAMAEIRPGHDEMFAVPWGAEPVIQRYHLDGTPIGDPVTISGLSTFLGAGYSRDGKHILVYDNNATGRLLDPDTLASVGTPFTVRGSRAGDVSWTPDGVRVALAADDGSIRIIRTEDGSVETTISGLTGGPFVEFLDDNRLLALTNVEAAEYDLRRTTAVGTTSARDQLVYDIVGLPSGTAALADQAQRIVQLTQDLSEGPVDITPPDYYASALAVSSDGKSAAIQTFSVDASGENIVDGFVNIVDLPSGSNPIRFKLNGQDLAARMSFSPDGTKLAVGTRGGSLAIFDARSGNAIVAVTQVDSGTLRALLWATDGSALYGGGQDGVLRVYDPSSGSVKAETILSPTIALTDADPVPETTLLAVASEQGEVYFVDTDTRKQVGQPLTSGGTQLQALAITPDAKRVASISRDGAVRLWDRSSGRAIGPPLQAHGVQASGITYLDDGRHLMTGGFDGTIVSWDMAPESWAARACDLAGRNLTQAEWKQYLPGKTYRKTCPAFAEG